MRDGFHVAAAIIDPSSDQAAEDPEVGTLKMYIKFWEINDFYFKEINTKPCSDGDSYSKFFELNTSSENYFERFSNKLKCIEDETL